MQTIDGSFLEGVAENTKLGVSANGYQFQMSVHRVNQGTDENPKYAYEIGNASWKSLVKNLRLEMGMTIVFAKTPTNWLWLMAFNLDGKAHTHAYFHGANRLRRTQLKLEFDEKGKLFKYYACSLNCDIYSYLVHKIKYDKHLIL